MLGSVIGLKIQGEQTDRFLTSGSLHINEDSDKQMDDIGASWKQTFYRKKTVLSNFLKV
jgi:hypothetical protein